MTRSKPAAAHHVHRRLDVGRERQVGLTSGKRAHVCPGMVDRVHPDAVAQQRSTGAAARGIDRHHGDGPVFVLGEVAAHHLVHQRGFARSAGAGDPDHRGTAVGGPSPDLLEHLGVLVGVVLGGGYQPSDQLRVGCAQLGEVRPVQLPEREVGTGDHVVDHPLETEAAPVVGRVDPGDAVAGELLAFLGEDGAPSTPEDPDVLGPAVHGQVPQIPEELHVAALVRGHRDRLGVLFDRRIDYLLARPVVPEMDDLGPRGLEDPPEDVDRSVVPVEQGGGGDEPDLVRRPRLFPVAHRISAIIGDNPGTPNGSTLPSQRCAGQRGGAVAHRHCSPIPLDHLVVEPGPGGHRPLVEGSVG